jgi:transposase
MYKKKAAHPGCFRLDVIDSSVFLLCTVTKSAVRLHLPSSGLSSVHRRLAALPAVHTSVSCRTLACLLGADMVLLDGG